MDAFIRPREFGWRAFARYNLSVDGHDLFAAYRDVDKQSWVVGPLTLTKSSGALETPMLTDTSGWSNDPEQGNVGDARGFLQVMMDAAWELGLRPTRLAEHDSEITAVRYHLEDMRKLAKVK